MSELIPIVGILALGTLLYLWSLVSTHQAHKNWQALQATYEIVGSTVPRGDIIHGVYYLRITYTFDGRTFSKLVTLNYNRHRKVAEQIVHNRNQTSVCNCLTKSPD